MTQTLPEFERPPLIEVVCGLQFHPFGLQTVHVGDLWRAMRDRYPSFEDHPPLSNIFDDSDRGARIEREDGDMPPLRRVFFVDESKNFLIQIGASRFLANWRRVPGSNAPYPRFDAAYARLKDEWGTFREYVARNELGAIRLNQYELTYINHMPDEANDLFTFFEWPALDVESFEPSPRNTQLAFQARFTKARGSLTRRAPD